MSVSWAPPPPVSAQPWRIRSAPSSLRNSGRSWARSRVNALPSSARRSSVSTPAWRRGSTTPKTLKKRGALVVVENQQMQTSGEQVQTQTPHRKADKAADDSCRGAQPPAGESVRQALACSCIIIIWSKILPSLWPRLAVPIILLPIILLSSGKVNKKKPESV